MNYYNSKFNDDEHFNNQLGSTFEQEDQIDCEVDNEPKETNQKIIELRTMQELQIGIKHLNISKTLDTRRKRRTKKQPLRKVKSANDQEYEHEAKNIQVGELQQFQ